MKLSIDDVKKEDLGIMAPCGIACLGCDMYKDESLKAAKTVVEIWEGFNLADVSVLLGLEKEEVENTLATLKKYITTKDAAGACPGCYIGGIAHCASCPIVDCAKSKGYWTCAECEDYDPESESPCPHTAPVVASPFESKGVLFGTVCKRYNGNNLDNLKRCRELGYPAFIEEIKGQINNGWRTWQVISKEKLLQG